MKYFVCLFLLISSSAYAATAIHKWIDEDGVTQYGDTPPPTVTSKELKVDSAPSDPGKALPRLGSSASGSNSGTSGSDGSNSAKSDSKVPEDQAKAACDQAKGDIKIIKSSNRIRLTNSDGSSRYMTTEEIKARRENAEKDIKSFC